MASKQRKVVISAAITGAIHTPAMSPYLPASPDSIIKNAVDAAKAGAAIVHIHARKENGEPAADFETFGKILSGIKRECDAVIGITTGGAHSMTTEERFSVIERFCPEMASANGGSMNFCFSHLADNLEPGNDWEIPYIKRTWENIFKNTFGDIEYCITTMNKCGTRPEFECFDYGQMANIAHFYRQGMVKEPVYLQFVPGVMGGMPMSYEGLAFMIDQAKKTFGPNVQYCSVAGGRRMFRFSAYCALLGGNVRVGLEDSLFIKPSGELAIDNAAQVAKIRHILEALDYEIASPAEAREQLQLKGADKVNF